MNTSGSQISFLVLKCRSLPTDREWGAGLLSDRGRGSRGGDTLSVALQPVPQVSLDLYTESEWSLAYFILLYNI